MLSSHPTHSDASLPTQSYLPLPPFRWCSSQPYPIPPLPPSQARTTLSRRPRWSRHSPCASPRRRPSTQRRVARHPTIFPNRPPSPGIARFLTQRSSRQQRVALPNGISLPVFSPGIPRFSTAKVGAPHGITVLARCHLHTISRTFTQPLLLCAQTLHATDNLVLGSILTPPFPSPPQTLRAKDHLVVGSMGKRSSWRLPYRELSGKVNVELLVRKQGYWGGGEGRRDIGEGGAQFLGAGGELNCRGGLSGRVNVQVSPIIPSPPSCITGPRPQVSASTRRRLQGARFPRACRRGRARGAAVEGGEAVAPMGETRCNC
jgi:hypothetical protein